MTRMEARDLVKRIQVLPDAEQTRICRGDAGRGQEGAWSEVESDPAANGQTRVDDEQFTREIVEAVREYGSDAAQEPQLARRAATKLRAVLDTSVLCGRCSCGRRPSGQVAAGFPARTLPRTYMSAILDEMWICWPGRRSSG